MFSFLSMFISSSMLRKNSRVLNLILWMYFRVGLLWLRNCIIMNISDRLNKNINIGGMLNRILLLMVDRMVVKNSLVIILLLLLMCIFFFLVLVGCLGFGRVLVIGMLLLEKWVGWVVVDGGFLFCWLGRLLVWWCCWWLGWCCWCLLKILLVLCNVVVCLWVGLDLVELWCILGWWWCCWLWMRSRMWIGWWVVLIGVCLCVWELVGWWCCW